MKLIVDSTRSCSPGSELAFRPKLASDLSGLRALRIGLMGDYTIESFVIISWQERPENCLEVRDSNAIFNQAIYLVVVILFPLRDVFFLLAHRRHPHRSQGLYHLWSEA